MGDQAQGPSASSAAMMSEMQPFLEQMRQQNEMQMQMFKDQMEDEFKRKMQLVMLNLNTGKSAPSSSEVVSTASLNRSGNQRTKKNVPSDGRHGLKSVQSAPALRPHQAEYEEEEDADYDDQRGVATRPDSTKFPVLNAAGSRSFDGGGGADWARTASMGGARPPPTAAAGVVRGETAALAAVEEEQMLQQAEAEDAAAQKYRRTKFKQPKAVGDGQVKAKKKLDGRNEFVYNKTANMVAEARRITKKSKRKHAKAAKKEGEDFEDDGVQHGAGAKESDTRNFSESREAPGTGHDYVTFKPTTANVGFLSPPATAKPTTAAVGYCSPPGSAMTSNNIRGGMLSGDAGSDSDTGRGAGPGPGPGPGQRIGTNKLTRKVSFGEDIIAPAPPGSAGLPDIVAPGVISRPPTLGGGGGASFDSSGLHNGGDVSSSQSHSRASSQASKRFVNSEELSTQEDKSHLQWQDDIARHVLTMYATSKIRRGGATPGQKLQSQTMLSFIDVKAKEAGLGDANADIYMDGSNVPSPHRKECPLEPFKDTNFPDAIAKELPPPYPNKVPFSANNSAIGANMNIIDVNGNQSMQNGVVDAVEEAAVAQEEKEGGASNSDASKGSGRGKRRSKKIKRLSKQKSRNARITDVLNGMRSSVSGDSFDITDALNEDQVQVGQQQNGSNDDGDEDEDEEDGNTSKLSRKVRRKPNRKKLKKNDGHGQQENKPRDTYGSIDVAHALQLDDLPDSFTTNSKFRTCYVVKNKNGDEVCVRGAPKCFPIWFVSAGELASNWERLPNGEELQAQLNVVYEKGHFEEYVGVVTSTLLELRKQIESGDLTEDTQEFVDTLAEMAAATRGFDGALSVGSAAVSGSGSPSRSALGLTSPAAGGGNGGADLGSPASTRASSPTKQGHGGGPPPTGSPSRAATQHRQRTRQSRGYDQYDSGGGGVGAASDSDDPGGAAGGTVSYADQLLSNAEFPDVGYKGTSSPNKTNSPTKKDAGGDAGTGSPSRAIGTAMGGSRALSRNPSTGGGLSMTANSYPFSPELSRGGGGANTSGYVSPSKSQRIELPPIDGRVEAKKLIQLYWKQAVGACIALSTISSSRKNFVTSLKLAQLAMTLCSVGGILSRRERTEMKAHAYNAMAYHFYANKKRTAALSHTRQAGKLHAKVGNSNYVAVCMLHEACIETQQTQFKEAHAVSTVRVEYNLHCCVSVLRNTALHDDMLCMQCYCNSQYCVFAHVICFA